MARTCPVCPSQTLSPVQAADVEIDVCPRCHGLWFDGGELEHFPDRPSLRPFLAAARQAPSRCRKQGHAVPRAMAACATCRGAPVTCPACGSRLSLVAAGASVIDLCVQCEGVWLDAGEFEQLQGVLPPRTMTAPSGASGAVGAASGWEVPEATDSSVDPWKGPGSDRPLVPLGPELGVPRSPMGCNHCGATVMAHRGYAKDGELYCRDCKPKGAVSGARLPVDRPSFGGGLLDGTNDLGYGVISWLVSLLR